MRLTLQPSRFRARAREHVMGTCPRRCSRNPQHVACARHMQVINYFCARIAKVNGIAVVQWCFFCVLISPAMVRRACRAVWWFRFLHHTLSHVCVFVQRPETIHSQAHRGKKIIKSIRAVAAAERAQRQRREIEQETGQRMCYTHIGRQARTKVFFLLPARQQRHVRRRQTLTGQG